MYLFLCGTQRKEKVMISNFLFEKSHIDFLSFFNHHFLFINMVGDANEGNVEHSLCLGLAEGCRRSLHLFIEFLCEPNKRHDIAF